jgi:hypothetical protein
MPRSRAAFAFTPLATAAGLASLLAIALPAQAAEGYKLRQSAVSVLGGEMAAGLDNPGFFGTASLASVRIERVVDGSGNLYVLPLPATVNLPTASKAGLPIPDGTYKLAVPANSVAFKQDQQQLNLVAGYVSHGLYGGGRIVAAVNLPLIRQQRSFLAVLPAGTVTPTPAATLPAAVRGALAQLAAAVNAQLQATVAGANASNNVDASGVGDAELSLGWLRHQDRLKLVAGVSLFVPTGSYDKTRGPNPGFGDFYTLRTGIAATYSLNPKHTDSAWDSGVTIAGRLAFGTNTRNRDTDYKSGDFIVAEAGIVKVSGNWAVGANLLSLQQTSADSGSGVPAGMGKLRNLGGGAFVSFKLPGKDAGFNLHYSSNFGSRSSLVAKTWQLRFIRAW